MRYLILSKIFTIITATGGIDQSLWYEQENLKRVLSFEHERRRDHTDIEEPLSVGEYFRDLDEEQHEPRADKLAFLDKRAAAMKMLKRQQPMPSRSYNMGAAEQEEDASVHAQPRHVNRAEGQTIGRTATIPNDRSYHARNRSGGTLYPDRRMTRSTDQIRPSTSTGNLLESNPVPEWRPELRAAAWAEIDAKPAPLQIRRGYAVTSDNAETSGTPEGAETPRYPNFSRKNPSLRLPTPEPSPTSEQPPGCTEDNAYLKPRTAPPVSKRKHIARRFLSRLMSGKSTQPVSSFSPTDLENPDRFRTAVERRFRISNPISGKGHPQNQASSIYPLPQDLRQSSCEVLSTRKSQDESRLHRLPSGKSGRSITSAAPRSLTPRPFTNTKKPRSNAQSPITMPVYGNRQSSDPALRSQTSVLGMRIIDQNSPYKPNRHIEEPITPLKAESIRSRLGRILSSRTAPPSRVATPQPAVQQISTPTIVRVEGLRRDVDGVQLSPFKTDG